MITNHRYLHFATLWLLLSLSLFENPTLYNTFPKAKGHSPNEKCSSFIRNRLSLKHPIFHTQFVVVELDLCGPIIVMHFAEGISFHKHRAFHADSTPRPKQKRRLTIIYQQSERFFDFYRHYDLKIMYITFKHSAFLDHVLIRLSLALGRFRTHKKKRKNTHQISTKIFKAHPNISYPNRR